MNVFIYIYMYKYIYIYIETYVFKTSRPTHMQTMLHTTFNLKLGKAAANSDNCPSSPNLNDHASAPDTLRCPHFFQDIHGKESHSGDHDISNGTEPLTILSRLGRSQPLLQGNLSRVGHPLFGWHAPQTLRAHHVEALAGLTPG